MNLAQFEALVHQVEARGANLAVGVRTQIILEIALAIVVNHLCHFGIDATFEAFFLHFHRIEIDVAVHQFSHAFVEHLVLHLVEVFHEIAEVGIEVGYQRFAQFKNASVNGVLKLQVVGFKFEFDVFN